MSADPQAREGLFRFVVTHPVAMTMVFLAALVFGWVSYQRLPIELMPDISYPTVTVRTVYAGAAPQEVETQISRPIEEALATLDGLVSIESRSRAGTSDVVLGFDWGTDMSASSQSIRENLQVTWLPQEAERPLILRYDPSLDPFVRLALSIAPEHPGVPEDPEAQLYLLRDLADNVLQRALEGMDGVAAVRVRGGLEREIRIEVREDWLSARGLTLEAVQQALGSENVNVAGGSVIEGDVEYLIRTLNEYTTADELRSLRLRRADGARIPLTDVARIHESHREREVVSRLNGGEAVELEIFREADANVVEVARRVQRAIHGDGVPAAWGGTSGLTAQLPEGVVLTLLDDQAAFIEAAVDNLWGTARLGGILAVGILFLFLRDLRATAIIGVAIPVSVLIGFAPLYLLDVSLNLMSLGGLALGVGMLVDNAVVVLESIQRYREEGVERFDAAQRGASEVAAAVTASTLTTVAVFLPISFVEGVAGELFGDLSIAVVSSLSASLAVALFGVPMLAALEVPSVAVSPADGLVADLRRGGLRGVPGLAWRRAIGAPRDEWRAWWSTGRARIVTWPWASARWVLRVGGEIGLLVAVLGLTLLAGVGARLGVWTLRPAWRIASRVAAAFQGGYGLAEAAYHRALPGVLSRPGLVLGAAALAMAVSLAATQVVGTELIPELHQGRFAVELALPVGTPLERTAAVVADAERITADHPEVETVYAAIGVDKRADARSDEGEHTARLRVQLTPGGDLGVREARVMEELRVQLAAIPRLQARMVRPSLFSFRTPVEVVVYGYDIDTLREVGEEVAATLSGVAGLRDVRSSLVRGYPEVRIRYDRERLHRLGLDAATVAGRVRDKVQGVEATQIRQGDTRVALRVQLDASDRETLDDLRRINVNPSLTPEIPLVAVADFEEAMGPSEIRRVDQQRAVVVSANVEGFDLGTAGARMTGALRALAFPDAVSWTVAGQSREMVSSLRSLRFALLLALFLVYVIMASTFEHLFHPLVILGTVPLAVVGAVLGLLVTGSSISVVVLIGAIVLAGVVVNNAIVLVDCIHRLQDEGMGRHAAVRAAGRLRMRPILITTSTTVLGLLPLALGFGAGAEMQGPLAITVIGGLVSSTALTLLVIPVVYSSFTRDAPQVSEAPEGAT